MQQMRTLKPKHTQKRINNTRRIYVVRPLCLHRWPNESSTILKETMREWNTQLMLNWIFLSLTFSQYCALLSLLCESPWLYLKNQRPLPFINEEALRCWWLKKKSSFRRLGAAHIFSSSFCRHKLGSIILLSRAAHILTAQPIQQVYQFILTSNKHR